MDRVRHLHTTVQRAYTEAARRPQDEHPFPVGRSFAESIGYPHKLLESIPSVSVDAFAGVSNVAIFADIPEGAMVLDLGCGSALDTLIAARRTGPKGKVISIDFSDAMLARARRAVEQASLGNVELHLADAEIIPVEDRAIDVALINGIFNLNPARDAIFNELARVVRLGGAVFASELILREPLIPNTNESEADWLA
jgi:SAM-dependent methyltransferase